MVGKLIKTLRNKMKLNQTDFGVLVGAKQNTVASWETEDRRPQRETAKKIVALAKQKRVTGITLIKLIG